MKTGVADGRTAKTQKRCAAALGHPEWCDDPRFATNRRRMTNREALEAEMEAVLTTSTTDHWVEVLEAAGGHLAIGSGEAIG